MAEDWRQRPLLNRKAGLKRLRDVEHLEDGGTRCSSTPAAWAWRASSRSGARATTGQVERSGWLTISSPDYERADDIDVDPDFIRRLVRSQSNRQNQNTIR